MKKLTSVVLISVLLTFLVMMNVGCEKEGPLEKAGKKMGEAVDEAKKAVDK